MQRILLCLILLTTALGAQDRVIRDFIKEHRKGEENAAVTVPGWMIGLASDIAASVVEDEDEKTVLEVIGEVGTIRLVSFDNDDFTGPESSVTNLLYSLERYKGFERWAEVRTREGQRLTLSVRYKKKTIRDLVAIIDEGERTTVVSARAHLSAEELGRMVNELEGM